MNGKMKTRTKVARRSVPLSKQRIDPWSWYPEGHKTQFSLDEGFGGQTSMLAGRLRVRGRPSLEFPLVQSLQNEDIPVISLGKPEAAAGGWIPDIDWCPAFSFSSFRRQWSMVDGAWSQLTDGFC
jgi:hypothetical protein